MLTEMSVSVKEFGKAWWSEVYNRIIGAAVYLDDVSAECLHWDGGLFNLLDGGAVAVKSLSPFEVRTQPDVLPFQCMVSTEYGTQASLQNS